MNKDIEKKIGFDEIRTLLKGHCISRLGTERVDDLAYQTDAAEITYRLKQVSEIGQIIDTELQLPGEDFLSRVDHGEGGFADVLLGADGDDVGRVHDFDRYVARPGLVVGDVDAFTKKFSVFYFHWHSVSSKRRLVKKI